MKITNGDKIRNMNDLELANWLDKISNQNREDYIGIGCYNCTSYGTHHMEESCKDCDWENGILGYLKLEFKGD